MSVKQGAVLVILLVVGGGAALLLWLTQWRTPELTAPKETNTNQTATPTPGVTGTLFSVSDVEGVPNIPMAGLITFFPQEQFTELRSALNLPSDLLMLHRYAFTLSIEHINTYNATAVATGDNGSFSVDLEPGGYVACLGNLGADAPRGLPAAMSGCTALTVGDSARAQVELGFGESGVSLER